MKVVLPRFLNMREPLSIGMLKSGRVKFKIRPDFFFSFQPEGPAPGFRPY